MKMNSISKKIKIVNRAKVSKDLFITGEIAPHANTEFTCCKCQSKNDLKITPFETGFPILQIYDENKILTKKELLENKMLTETSIWMEHFGELTVNDLPTLYFGTACNNCQTGCICIFGYGEKQPGLTLLQISGVWQYEYVI